MRRRGLLVLPGAAIVSLTVAGSAFAANRGELPRIAILLNNSRWQYPGPDHPVLLGLRDVGLIDGKTATLLVREAEGHTERLPQLAAELVAQKPDVIVVAGSQSIAALKNATATIPIVTSEKLFLTIGTLPKSTPASTQSPTHAAAPMAL